MVGNSREEEEEGREGCKWAGKESKGKRGMGRG